MRKLLFLFSLLLFFVACKQPEIVTPPPAPVPEKKLVEKTIDVKFKGEKLMNISDASGVHPLLVTCEVKSEKDAPKIEIYYTNTENEDDAVLIRSSDTDAVEVSLMKQKMTHSDYFYGKAFFYYLIYVDGELKIRFTKFAETSNFLNEQEIYYTVYE